MDTKKNGLSEDNSGMNYAVYLIRQILGPSQRSTITGVLSEQWDQAG